MTTLLCMICLAGPTISDAQKSDLVRTIKAIHQTETSGRLVVPDGDRGRSVGPLQCSLGVLEDVNHLYGATYTSSDRRNFRKSCEICVRYLWMYEPNGNPEAWSRLWCSGPAWRTKKHKTDRYWRRIQNVLKGQ